MADPLIGRPGLLLPPIMVSENDLKLEQGLLGALLMNPSRAIPRIPEGFSSSHYSDDLHRDLHDAIIDIGPGSDPVIVGQTLNLAPNDRTYLAQLLVAGVSWMLTEDYARGITEASNRREIQIVMHKIAEELERGSRDAPASSIINLALARLDALGSGTQGQRGGSTFDSALDAALEQTTRAARGEQMAGRSTGMASVDEALGGLENGTFNILAARPGMGKTALGCQWAVHVSRACKLTGEGGVLAFSLEMPALALARRCLSEVSKISVVDLKRGRIDGRVQDISRARHELRDLPIFIEDAGGQNLVAIRQKARAAQRKFKHLSLIMIDHLSIVKPDDIDRKHGATQAVGRISNALRDLSKEFDCPVLCLSQLNRNLISRDDKRPNLGDLRQSGDIEQDADTVMFLHREEMFLPKNVPEQTSTETQQKYQERVRQWEDARARSTGQAELIFEKVRDGAPCSVALEFNCETISFSEAGLVPKS